MNAVRDGPQPSDPAITDTTINGLFAGWERYKRIALAVSGGADSTALMLLVHVWLERAHTPGPDIHVLTVDHGLRAASAAEAEWVKDRASALGFIHRTLRWQASKPKTGVQAGARAARYALMTQHCREAGIEALATAHNQGDQAETMLMRLARGSGVDGLAAMAERTCLDGIVLLRPLLALTRAQLESFLRERGQDWLEDPSNRDETYERVRVRQRLSSGDVYGLTAGKLALSAKRLRRARDALDTFTADFLKMVLRLHPAGYGELALDALFATPEEIALKALARMACAFGGRQAPPQLARLEFFYESLRSGARDATLGGCAFAVRRGELRVTREYGRMDKSGIAVHPGQGVLWDGRFVIALPQDTRAPLSLRPFGPDSLAAIKAAGGGMGDLPRAAALALPSLWDDGGLRFAPFVVWRGDAPHGFLAGVNVEFVSCTKLFEQPLLTPDSDCTRI